MAASGLLMVGFLVLHMVGNLKIFFGSADFDGYAHWLRTIGQPVLPWSSFLWIQRLVLVVALVVHAVAAAQLSRRDLRARPVRYAHRPRRRATYATRTMRYGGVIVGLFLIWHILDLTVGRLNPDFRAGHPYHNVVADFRVWWINVIYIVAVVLVGLHLEHGVASAARSLGVTTARREHVIRVGSTLLAAAITAGFVAVPIGVMTGLVS